ncbi:MAG: hypothetical protein ABSG69_01200 [Candidatus Acidiferrum sp.]
MCKKFGIGKVLAVCVASAAFLCGATQGRGQNSAGSSRAKEGAKALSVSSKPFENWTQLDVRDSAMVMKRPELAQKEDTPGASFIRERYQANWRDIDPFDLYVIRPKGTAKVPVILYLYSFPEDTDQFKNNNWCDTAVSGGYAAVGFVGAVTGHRTRYRPAKDWFVGNMQEALGSTVHDVQFILDYLATRSDLDMNHVGIFAMGSGGAVAVMASAVDPRIQVVDLLGPWGDWPKWTGATKVIPDDERANFVTAEFQEKLEPLEPVNWLPKVHAKELRIQDVRGNKSVPDDAQKSLEGAAPDFAVINQYENGRAFLANQPPITLFDWLKAELKADGKSSVALEKSQRIHFYPAPPQPTQDWPNVGTLDTSKPAKAPNANAEKQQDKPKEQKER